MLKNQHKNTILLVDDNTDNLQFLSYILSDNDWQIAVLTDGETAIAQVEYNPPDLILLDVMMPGIDGFETCRRLKANPQTQDIPVIFMTALSDNKVKGLNLGAVDYITKPFQEEEVLARVKVHLKLHSLSKTLEKQNVLLKQFNIDLEQKVAERTHDLKQAQVQLVQSEKMSSLGQLIAGVAYEINHPVSSILGNLTHAEEYIYNLIDHLNLYQQLFPKKAEIDKHAQKIDLEYLRSDLPNLISSMKMGTERISEISTSLRAFSRSDTSPKEAVNIHEGLDSTLLILKHRLRANAKHPTIEIIKEYGHLPLVKCYPGHLNQVFMNIIANAIDALEESNFGRSYAEISDRPNVINIRTQVSSNNNSVVIRIKDNGNGMSDEVKERVFDPFFTTKSPGNGAGLGLAISYKIIVEKHGGSLRASSIPGRGTELVIEIPLSVASN